MAGCVLMEVTRRSNRPSSDCHCVVGATRNVSVVAVFELLFNDIGSKTNSCYLHHHQPSKEPHRWSSASPAFIAQPLRLTFNWNVVKLLDFVLEWQNPYSVTVNVVVPLHNVTYSRMWLLLKG